MAPECAAVAIAEQRTLGVQIEGARHRVAAEQLKGLLAKAVLTIEHSVDVPRVLQPVELADEPPTVFEPGGIRPGIDREVGRPELCNRRIARDVSAVAQPQIGGVRHEGLGGNADVLRQAGRMTIANAAGDHSQIGMLGAGGRCRIGAGRSLAGQQFDRAIVVGRHLMMQ